MSVELLLKEFHRISEAPDAVPRLRRSILDLALRGKLVRQCLSDEPAISFLRRSYPERSIRPASDEARIFGASSSSAQPPFEIPESWVWVRFGLVHQLIRGVSYTKSDQADTPTAGYVPILRANNIGAALNFDDPVFVRQERIAPEQFLKKGDYLIALSSGSRNLVGKAAYVPKDLGFAFGAFCGVIRVFPEILRSFIGVFLTSSLYRESLAKGSRGIGINNLKKEVLSNLLLPLPPILEQERIACKVKDLMLSCENLRTAQAEREARRDKVVTARLGHLTTAHDESSFNESARLYLKHLPRLTTGSGHIQQLRQALIDLAVQGKISLQFQDHSRKGNAYSSPVATALHPARWQTKHLRDLVDPARKISYGVLVPGPDIPGGVPFVRVQDLYLENHPILPSKRISAEIENQYARTRLQGDEILVCLVGATIGKIGTAPDSWAGANIARAVGRIVPGLLITRDFLVLALRSTMIQQSFRASTRTLAQPTLNVSLIEETPVPIPPLHEQQLIVTKVKELLNGLDELESSLPNLERIRTCFLSAVLSQIITPTDKKLELAQKA